MEKGLLESLIGGSAKDVKEKSGTVEARPA